MTSQLFLEYRDLNVMLRIMKPQYTFLTYNFSPRLQFPLLLISTHVVVGYIGSGLCRSGSRLQSYRTYSRVYLGRQSPQTLAVFPKLFHEERVARVALQKRIYAVTDSSQWGRPANPPTDRRFPRTPDTAIYIRALERLVPSHAATPRCRFIPFFKTFDCPFLYPFDCQDAVRAAAN